MIIPDKSKSSRVERASGNQPNKTIMAKAFKRIIVPYGGIKKLAEKHQCSDKYVSMALRGAYDTPKAEAVRVDAKKM